MSRAFAVVAIASLGSGVAVAAGRSPSVAHTARVSGCKLTAAAPTEANDQITGTGSIRCKTSRSLHVHIETQVFQAGQWGTFGSWDGPVHVRARKTRHVSTVAPCKGLGGPNQVRTVLSLTRFPRTLAKKTSPTAQLTCSAHPH